MQTHNNPTSADTSSSPLPSLEQFQQLAATLKDNNQEIEPQLLLVQQLIQAAGVCNPSSLPYLRVLPAVFNSLLHRANTPSLQHILRQALELYRHDAVSIFSSTCNASCSTSASPSLFSLPPLPSSCALPLHYLAPPSHINTQNFGNINTINQAPDNQSLQQPASEPEPAPPSFLQYCRSHPSFADWCASRVDEPKSECAANSAYRQEVDSIMLDLLITIFSPSSPYYSRVSTPSSGSLPFLSSLHVDSKVDYLSSIGWVPAFIEDLIQFTEEHTEKFKVRIEYNGDFDIVDRFSSKLCPLGSRSSTNWRLLLDCSSVLDAKDRTGKWYSAVVVGVRDRGNDLQIHFDGWSSQYDEWIPRNSNKLAPWKSRARGGKIEGGVEGPENVEFEEKVELTDLIAYFCCIPHTPTDETSSTSSSSSSDEVLDSPSSTAPTHLPGFQLFLYRLIFNNRAEPLSIQNISRHLMLITSILSYLPSSQLSCLTPLVRLIVCHGLLELSDVELRKLSRELVAGIVQSLTTLINVDPHRYPPPPPIQSTTLAFNYFQTPQLTSATPYMDEFQLKLSHRRLLCPIVERKINALAFYHDYISQVRTNHAFYSKPELIAYFRDTNVLELCFSRDSHPELMKKTLEIYKFMLGEAQLMQQDLMHVWNAIRRAMDSADEIALTILYKLLDDMLWQFQSQHILFLLECVSSIPLPSYLPSTLSFLQELIRCSGKVNEATQKQAINLWWSVMHSDAAPASIRSFAIDKFEDLMTAHKEHRLYYCEQCLLATPPNLSLLRRIIETYPDITYTIAASMDYPTKSAIIDYLNQNFQIIDKFFNNLKHIVDLRREEERRESEKDSTPNNITTSNSTTISSPSSSPAAFIKSIQSNFDFLQYIFTNSTLKFTMQQFETLWQLFSPTVQSSSSTSSISSFPKCFDIFLRWLMLNCSIRPPAPTQQHYYHAPKPSAPLLIFESTQMSRLLFDYLLAHQQGDMELPYYNCIEALFLHMNYHEKKVECATSYSSSSDSCDFVVVDHNLSCLDAVWNTVLTVDNQQVTTKSIAFLNSLHENIHPSLLPQLHTIRTEYLSRCFASLKHGLASDDRHLIIRCLRLLHDVLDLSERAGVAGLRAHGQLARGKPITLYIQHQIVGCNKPQKKKIQICRNDTLWDLRFLISQYLEINIEHLKLFTMGQILEVDSNSHYLSSLGIKSFQSILVTKKSITIPRVDLLDKDQRPTLGMTHVFSEIYSKFATTYTLFPPNPPQTDEDITSTINSDTLQTSAEAVKSSSDDTKNSDDEKLNEEKTEIAADTDDSDTEQSSDSPLAYGPHPRPSPSSSPSLSPSAPAASLPPASMQYVMSFSDMATYILSCGAEPDSASDERLKKIFRDYCKDDPTHTYLSFAGFLEFYRDACLDRLNNVWNDLKAHGYREDLKKEGAEVKRAAEVENDQKVLPRYLLANDQNYFDVLFDALNHVDADVALNSEKIAPLIWSLLQRLPTNPVLYAHLYSLDQIKSAHHTNSSSHQINEEHTVEFVPSTAPISWDALFDSHNIYKLLYSLQILEKLIEPDSSPDGDKEREDWNRTFLQFGGFQHLYRVLVHSPLLSHRSGDHLHQQCLALLVKFIHTYVMSALATLNKAPPPRLRAESIDALSETEKKQEELLMKLEREREENSNSEMKSTNPFIYNPKKASQSSADDSDSDDSQSGDDLPDTLPPPSVTLLTRQMSLTFAHLVLDSVEFDAMQQMTWNITINAIDNPIYQHNHHHAPHHHSASKAPLSSSFTPSSSLFDIVESALGLVINLTLHQTSLLPNFYQMVSSPSPNGGAPHFFSLLFNSHLKVRKLCIRSIQELCSHAVLPPAAEYLAPAKFFLEFLVTHLLGDNNIMRAHHECDEFFALLFFLLQSDLSSSTSASSYTSLLSRLLRLFLTHSCNDTVTSPDKTLTGLLNTICQLLERTSVDKSQLNREHYNEDGQSLLFQIFHSYLFFPFSSTAPPHITSPSSPKSCNPSTRALLFRLVTLLCDNVENYAETLDYIQQLTSNISTFFAPSPHTSSTRSTLSHTFEYSPCKLSRSNGYVGLRNMGSTCYMNALLQQFYMMPLFRRVILECSQPSTDQWDDNDQLLHQLKSMFSFLALSNKQSFNTEPFTSKYKDEFGVNPINVRIQQDAQEFFNIFNDRLEKALLKTQLSSSSIPFPSSKLISSLFSGQLLNQLICHGGCRSIRESPESFLSISLEVKNKATLEESMESYVYGERLSDFNCSACGKKTDITKRICISEANDIIIFHLKRFELNFETFQHEKLNHRFVFPLELNIEPYTKEGLQRVEHARNDTSPPTSPVSARPPEYYHYTLTGVLVHTGSAQGGHYFSIIKERPNESMHGKEKREKLNESRWFEFNDTLIRPFSLSSLDETCFGGESEVIGSMTTGGWSSEASEKVKNAYMLIYERTNKLTNIQQSNQDSQQQSSKEQEHSSNSDSSLSLSPSIQSQIYLDNQQFLLDSLVFQSEFFEFLESFLKLTPASWKPADSTASPNIESQVATLSLSPTPSFQSLLQLSTMFFIDTILHSQFDSKSTFVFQYVNTLLSLYSHSPSNCLWYLSLLLSQQPVLFDILLTCKDPYVRQAFIALTSGIYRQAYAIPAVKAELEAEIASKLKELEQSSDVQLLPYETLPLSIASPTSLPLRFFHLLFTFLPDAPKHWHRFVDYFQLLHDLIQIHDVAHYSYFIRHYQLITALIDLVLGNDSALVDKKKKRLAMGNMSSQPSFPSLLSLLSLLLRACVHSSWINDHVPIPMTLWRPAEQVGKSEEEEFFNSSMAQQFTILHASQLDMLMNSQFYWALLHTPLDSLVPLVLHLQYEHFEFTKFTITSVIIQGIQKSNDKNATQIWKIMNEMIGFRDSLEARRYSMLLKGVEPDKTSNPTITINPNYYSTSSSSSFISSSSALVPYAPSALLPANTGLLHLYSTFRNHSMKLTYLAIENLVVYNMKKCEAFRAQMMELRSEWQWMDSWLKDYSNKKQSHLPNSVDRSAVKSLLQQYESLIVGWGGEMHDDKAIPLPGAVHSSSSMSGTQLTNSMQATITHNRSKLGNALANTSNGHSSTRSQAARIKQGSVSEVEEMDDADDEDINPNVQSAKSSSSPIPLSGSTSSPRVEEADLDDEQASSYRPRSSSHDSVVTQPASLLNEQWQCTLCTYLNNGIFQKCEMCNTDRAMAMEASSLSRGDSEESSSL